MCHIKPLRVLVFALVGMFLLTAGSTLFAAGARRISASNVIRLQSVTPQGLTPVVVGVSLNLDSSRLVTVGDDHKARVWDISASGKGRLIHEMSDQIDWVRSVKYRPDGEVFVTAGMDQKLYCYDAKTFTRTPQTNFESTGFAVRSISFSPDSERMAAVGFDASVCVYETTYGRIRRRWPTLSGDQRCVQFSPDSRFLAAAGRDGVVLVFDVTTGAVVKELQKHTRRVNTLTFSPDGKFLVSGGDDRNICVWSMEDMSLVKTLAFPSGKVSAAAFCGDDYLAVGSTNNSIRVWNFASNSPDADFYMDEHRGTVAELIWDEKNQTLISCSFDTTVRFWKIADTGLASAAEPILR